MPSLDTHASSRFTKLLYVGNSGSGKTGSLTSLIAAGYKLRIIDMDNGLDALVNHARADGLNLSSVEYISIRDTYSFGAMGPRVKGSTKAFVKAIGLLDKWEDGSNPAEWGDDTILVIDTLTSLGVSAFEWAKKMNPTFKDPRLWYAPAQKTLEEVIMALTSESFQTNVIVVSHIDYREDAGLEKGFVSAIGKALGPKLPRAFNTMILAETSGTGQKVRRRIKTYPTATIDLKNPAPMRIDAEYPLESGLASIFALLKGTN